MESGVACLGPPMNINSINWELYISSLELGLDFCKEGKNLEQVIEEYKEEHGFKKRKQDVEKFLDCIEDASEGIKRFYKKEYEFKMPEKICGEIDYLDVQAKLRDYSKDQIGDSEKIYCKLIADLKFATKIILGKEKGPLGNYAKHFENVIKYLKYNRPISFEEKNSMKRDWGIDSW